jgi:hypothetical protein
MRNPVLIVLAAALAMAGPAWSAPEAHDYRLVSTRAGEFDFWDVANLARSDGEVEVSLLNVYRFVDDRPGRPNLKTVVGVRRYRISCEWRTARLIENSAWDSDVTHKVPFMVAAPGADKPSFLGADSPEGQILHMVCTPGATLPVFSVSSAKAAAAYAEQREPSHVRPPNAPPIFFAIAAPLPRPGAEQPTPDHPAGFTPFDADTHHFVVLTRSAANGGVVLFDQDTRHRTGDNAVDLTLWFLGPQTPDAAASVAIRRSTFDCRARTSMLFLELSWDRRGWNSKPNFDPPPPHAVAHGSIAEKEMNAACDGAPSGPSYEDLNAALAYVRGTWAANN